MRIGPRFIQTLVVTLVAFSASGNSDLKISSGLAGYHNSTPIPISELIENAHQDAIKRLGEGKFQRVSEWNDEGSCARLSGASSCFDGRVRSEASFVADKDYNDTWQVTLKDERAYSCGIDDPATVSRALRDSVEKKAAFFCNGRLVLPPLEEKEDHRECYGEQWYGSIKYLATFPCAKAN